MHRWAGRVAMVTGASSGIGAAITKELVMKGLRVVGVARRMENIEVSSQIDKLSQDVCLNTADRDKLF
jgi:NADP-dependent 3-hydroxy acid dehydrogenase YdfG